MQELDDHIDELLRKAANEYGVKPGASNWEIIASRLKYNDTPAKKTWKKNKAYLVTMFLVVLIVLTGSIFNRLNQPPKNIKVSKSTGPGSESNNSAGTTQATTGIPGIKEVIPGEENNRYILPSQEKIRNYELQDLKIKTADGFPAIVSTSKATGKFLLPFDEFKIPYDIQIVKDDSISVLNEEQATVTNVNSTKPVLNSNYKRGAYMGLLTGISLNTVKQQDTKAGFDVGAIAGYRFNKKFSVETGLLFSRRNYYSDGKYFSMENMGSSMPDEMHIMYLTGQASMFEIPLNLSYAVINNNKRSLYVSGGTSSYILLNEKNDYMTELNGTEKSMQASYKKSSGYFAAALNITISYEYTLNKNNALRIAPYVQLPFKGIGVGELPVASAGLHVGFTFPIHK